MEICPSTPFIFFSGTLGEENAIKAMKYGATDYVLKKWVQKLPLSIVRAIDERNSIIKRMKAELDLKRSEKNYRDLVENSVVGIYKTNLDGKIIFANNSLAEIFGYSNKDDLIGENAANFYKNPDNRKRLTEKLKAGQTVDLMEIDIVDKNNITKQIRLSAALNENYISGIINDISESKKAESALMNSEKKLRTITDSAKDAIIMMDHNGIVTFWNNAAQDIFGYEESEIIGQILHKTIVPERFYGQHILNFKEWTKSGKGNAVGKTLELIGLNKSGQEFPVELSLSAIKVDSNWVAVGILRDISDRKAIEYKIKKNLESLHQAEEIASLGYFERNWKTGECYWSNGFFNLLGFKDKDFSHSQELFFKYIHPDDLQIFQNKLQESLDNKKSLDIRFKMINRRNELIHIHGLATNSYDEKGHPALTIGVFRDITEELKTQKELKGSELRLDHVLKSSNLGTWDWKLSNNSIVFGYNWYSMLGYDESDLEEKPETFFNLLHPDDSKTLKKILDDHISGKFPEFSSEIRMKSKSGGWKWIQTAGKCIEKDKDGNPLRLTGIHIDIDKIKKNEEELINYRNHLEDLVEQKTIELKKSYREVRKLFQAVEQSPASVVITDENVKITYVNKSFEQVTGYETEEVLGKNPNILKSGKHSSIFYKSMWNTINSGKVWKGDIQNKKKGGELYWERSHIAPILNQEGNIISYVAVKEDISKEKEQEQDLLNAFKEIKKSNDTMNSTLDELKRTQSQLVQSEKMVAFRAINCRCCS